MNIFKRKVQPYITRASILLNSGYGAINATQVIISNMMIHLLKIHLQTRVISKLYTWERDLSYETETKKLRHTFVNPIHNSPWQGEKIWNDEFEPI